MILIMRGLNFLFQKQIIAKLKGKTIFALMCFVMRIINFVNCMDLLLISDESKSHYVYVKDFDRFMCNKTKTKKNIFANVVYSVLVVKKF